jgi:hypothetical protein
MRGVLKIFIPISSSKDKAGNRIQDAGSWLLIPDS